MNTITKLLVLVTLCLFVSKASGQNKELDSLRKVEVDYKIVKLEEEMIKVEDQEKAILKIKVEKINKQLEKGEITQEEAASLKKTAAKKTALNIENRLDIIDKKIALLKRNGYDEYQYTRDYNGNKGTISLSSKGIHFNLDPDKPKKPKKYDKRTTSDLVFAIGFNQAISEGKSLNDMPYRIGSSGFVELGVAWKTRLLKNSNFFRLKYGFSFQWNKLKPKDNQYFVQNGGVTTLETFPVDLDKSKFRVTNLVVPAHLEFGPSKKKEHKSYFRYTTHKQFKIGFGGYAGLRLQSLQKLEFNENGEDVNQKIKRNYNASDFVYGLSAYIGIGNTSLYAKYDLNPLFKDQTVDQNNISIGVRFDFD